MRFVVALVLLMLAAPTVRADNSTPAEASVRPEVVQPAVSSDAPTPPDLVLEEVRIVEQRTAPNEAAVVQDMPRRGSFWWLVGVIVVAGVILAVLVD